MPSPPPPGAIGRWVTLIPSRVHARWACALMRRAMPARAITYSSWVFIMRLNHIAIIPALSLAALCPWQRRQGRGRGQRRVHSASELLDQLAADSVVKGRQWPREPAELRAELSAAADQPAKIILQRSQPSPAWTKSAQFKDRLETHPANDLLQQALCLEEHRPRQPGDGR